MPENHDPFRDFILKELDLRPITAPSISEGLIAELHDYYAHQSDAELTEQASTFMRDIADRFPALRRQILIALLIYDDFLDKGDLLV